MKKFMDTLRSTGGMVAILGVICILVGPTIGTIAGSNAMLAAVGGVILLAGYILIAVGLVMIVLAMRRARRQAGRDKT